MWPYINNRIIWGLIVFQLTVMGIFGLKGHVVASTLSAPLPVITLVFAWFMYREFHQSTYSIPLDLALQLDEAERDHLAHTHDPCYFHNPALRVGPTELPFINGLNLPPVELGMGHDISGSESDGIELVLAVPSDEEDEDDQEILLPNRKGKSRDLESGGGTGTGTGSSQSLEQVVLS